MILPVLFLGANACDFFVNGFLCFGRSGEEIVQRLARLSEHEERGLDASWCLNNPYYPGCMGNEGFERELRASRNFGGQMMAWDCCDHKANTGITPWGCESEVAQKGC